MAIYKLGELITTQRGESDNGFAKEKVHPNEKDHNIIKKSFTFFSEIIYIEQK